MSQKIENQSLRYDAVKWSVVVLLALFGVGMSYYYANQMMLVRMLGWLFLLAIMAVIAAQTQKGRDILQFAKESRVELRKVIWPARKETIQATTAVVLMVIVASLLLWGIDGLLLWIVGLLTRY